MNNVAKVFSKKEKELLISFYKSLEKNLKRNGKNNIYPSLFQSLSEFGVLIDDVV
jgi:hypothetical protein